MSRPPKAKEDVQADQLDTIIELLAEMVDLQRKLLYVQGEVALAAGTPPKPIPVVQTIVVGSGKPRGPIGGMLNGNRGM